jgi:DNA-binding transcriptional MerR regulator
MHIGEFAQSIGVSPRQVRYWSIHHVLPDNRDQSGYREYCKEDSKIALRVRDMLSAGLSIEQVQRLSSCLNYERGVCLRERAELKAKAEDIEQQIQQLTVTKSIIEEVLRSAPIIKAPES